MTKSVASRVPAAMCCVPTERLCLIPNTLVEETDSTSVKIKTVNNIILSSKSSMEYNLNACIKYPPPQTTARVFVHLPWRKQYLTVSLTKQPTEGQSDYYKGSWNWDKINSETHILLKNDKKTYPLYLNTLRSIHIVTFSVSGKVLGVCRRSWLKVLGILCQFQSFGFLPWLITELYQSHSHSQPQPSDQNIEDTSHIAQA